MKRTGYVFREEYMWHNTGIAANWVPAGGYVQPDIRHGESSDSKRRIDGLLAVSSLKKQLTIIDNFDPLTDEQIALFHTRDYMRRVKEMSDYKGGDAGELTPFGPGSYEIAALSAAAPLVAGRAILRAEISNAYVLNRPPGHHAEADRGRGFCIFANGVLAALNLRKEFGEMKIAFIDWDVHHGNGAQKAFYSDPSTLTISLHQDRNYPIDSGHAEEIGEGPGKGYNINVPLPPGSGHGAYLHTMDTVVLPALEAFKPDMIFILSGFDASAFDPFGRNMAHSGTYREMATKLKSAAERLCGGRLLVMHEGGYSPAYTPFCGIAVVETLIGVATDVVDPFLDTFSKWGWQELQKHQADVIAKSAEIVTLIK